MRHFENYEIEHLLNSTGSIFLRWRCSWHLKQCSICRQRMNKVIEERNFANRFKQDLPQNSGNSKKSIPGKNG